MGMVFAPDFGGAFMKSILDPSFRYVPSTQTDVRKTFARERRRLREAQVAPPPPINVMTIVARSKLLA